MAKTSVLTIMIALAKSGNADDKVIKSLSQMKMSVGQVMGALGALAGVGYTLNKVYESTTKVFLQYATQVRDLSRLTGASAADSSRLIQVADDLTISYESLQKSLWFASKNGFDVNIESLAQLADQYNATSSASGRAALLAKNFGKSGAEMGKLMEQGGDGVLKMSAAIESGLILYEASLKKARELEIAQDSLNDKWMAAKIIIGEQLVPPLTTLINAYLDTAAAQEIAGVGDLKWAFMSDVARQVALDEAQAQRELATALLLGKDAAADLSKEQGWLTTQTDDVTASTRVYLDALKELWAAQGKNSTDKADQELANVASSARLAGLGVLYLGATFSGVTPQIVNKAYEAGAGVDKGLQPATRQALEAGQAIHYMNDQLWHAKALSGSVWDYYFRMHVSGSVPRFGGAAGFSGGVVTQGGGFFSGSMLAGANYGAPGQNAAGGLFQRDVNVVGEEGYELVVRKNGQYVVIPHGMSKFLIAHGLVSPGQGLAGGGGLGSSIGGGGLGGNISEADDRVKGSNFSGGLGGTTTSGKSKAGRGSAGVSDSSSGGSAALAVQAAVEISAPMLAETAAAARTVAAVIPIITQQVSAMQRASQVANDELIGKVEELISEQRRFRTELFRAVASISQQSVV